MNGHHHLHVRKRVYKNLEPYPSTDALKRGFDKVMFAVAFFGPLATLPQVMQVFETKDVEGLSLVTWVLWLLLSVIWGVYGVLHKETPIIVSQVMYAVLHTVVIIAIFVYG